MLKPLISEFLSDFKPKTHAIVFYDNQENTHDLLFNRSSVQRAIRALLTFVLSKDRLRFKEMKEFGTDVDTGIA